MRAGSAENLEGERKTVTALFADIKGSTELEQDLDPEEARAIVDPALKLMIEAVRRYDGYIVQSTGDGIFALFGAPVAHEDHAQRALYAALRIHDENRRYADKLRAEGRSPLQIRIGADTGEVVVRTIETGGKTEYTPIGHTANMASRMQSLANPGTTVIAESTRRLVEGYFALKSLGASRVKGIAEPIHVYEVVGLGMLRTRLQRSAGRGLTKFVGREREMEALLHAAEQARSAHGQIVAAMAEPGVGKSRLYHEFKTRNQSGWMVLETVSVSHGKASAFLPVIDLLWGYFRIIADDDERTRREKITGRLLALDRSLEDSLPYLFALMGLAEAGSSVADIEPQTRKRRSLEAIKRILLRESLNQPLMLIFEDLHWIDSESQTFLNLLADSIGTAKVLVLVNYRPEYRHDWSGKTYYTQLRLDPLGQESAHEMLAAMLGDGKELSALKRMILDKTEGNPLFIEEIVRTLFEEGALKRNGAVHLMRPLDTLKVPPTVQAVLAARIDRLPADQKDLLQTVAIVGKDFRLGLIVKLFAGANDELERKLGLLQLAEFVYEQPVAGDTEYTFKHALTHDVAYNSVLVERRRLLHERIAAAVESLYPLNLDDHLAELAHHYARSSNAAKAAEYCLRACQQGSDRGSYVEGIAHYEAGLAALQKLPDDDGRAELELDLINTAFPALITIKGYGSGEGEDAARRASELAQRKGISTEKAWLGLSNLCTIYINHAQQREARQHALELVARAKGGANEEQLAIATSLLAFVEMFGGAFELAAEGFARATVLFESLAQPDRAAKKIYRLSQQLDNDCWSGWNLWFLGYPDQAFERCRGALEIARKSGSKPLLELANNYTFEVDHLRRASQEMRAHGEATLALALELGNSFRRAVAEMFLGWEDILSGDYRQGLPRMRENLELFKATGSATMSMYMQALIASALGYKKQFDEGLSTIEEAFAAIEQTNERFYEAEIYRLKGELLRTKDASKSAEAERCFRIAFEVARQQSAKSWELRAATSLAQLLRDTNRRDEARAMLAEIYNWFTEGFDTADLKDAKQLLEELALPP